MSKRRKTIHMASLATSENQWTQATPRLEIIANESVKVPNTGFRSVRYSTLEILFQSFEQLVQSFLVRQSHSDEPHA
jgi:hypothetical protein